MKIEGDPLNTQHAQHRSEEDEEAVFTSVVNTNEDPPNAHQAQEEEEEEEEEEAVFISVVNTNEDPPNAHQVQHRPVQATGAMSA